MALVFIRSASAGNVTLSDGTVVGNLPQLLESTNTAVSNGLSAGTIVEVSTQVAETVIELSRILPLNLDAGMVWANKGLKNAGKSKPLYSYNTVSVAANTTASTAINVVSVPPGKAWLLKTSVISIPSGSNNITVNGLYIDQPVPTPPTQAIPTSAVQTGQSDAWATGGVVDTKDLVAYFGDYLLSQSNVMATVQNTNTTSAQSVVIVLYGWEVTLP